MSDHRGVKGVKGIKPVKVIKGVKPLSGAVSWVLPPLPPSPTLAKQLAADIERLKAQYPELVNDVANEDEWLERLTVIER